MRRLLFLVFLLSPVFSFAQKQGQAYLDSLQEQLSHTQNDTAQIRLLVLLASKYWAIDPNTGIGYAQKSLAAAKRINWKSAVASSYSALATNYMFMSDYKTAIDNADLSQAIYEEQNDKKGIAKIYGTKCIIYMDLSNYPKALDYGFRALAINEGLNDKSNIARNLTNIGIIYEEEGDHKQALDFHTRALNLYKERNDKNSIAIALSNIGLIYTQLKDYDKALDVQMEALKICETLGNNNVMSKIIGYIGDIYSDKKDYPKALQYLFKALLINRQLGNTADEAEKMQNIGLTYLAMAQDKSLKATVNSNLDSSINYLSGAAAIHKKISNIKDLSENYRDLSTVQEMRGNYKEALYNNRQYMLNKDTLYNKEKNKQISELQTQYETKVKDKQIATQKKELAYNRKINISLIGSSLLLLAIGVLAYANQRKTAKLNKQITSQKTELEKLNTVKDRMFSIISHDLRSPVNALMSFTYLVEHGNVSPEKLQAYMGVLKNNLSYTASLMENLLNWARTQMQGYKPVFERFDIANTAFRTVELLNTEAINKGIVIKNEVHDTIVFADENMTALLLRNLLSNAIKYTPQGGSITLAAKHITAKVQLSVTDTGLGIPGHLVTAFNKDQFGQSIESTPGTNKEKGTGLGLMLCKSFAALMDGHILLQSTVGHGSTFTLELPA